MYEKKCSHGTVSPESQRSLKPEGSGPGISGTEQGLCHGNQAPLLHKGKE